MGPGRFVPRAQDDLAPSGAQARFRANLAALRVLRTLQAEERAATEAERTTLVRWGSWGASGVAEVFDESRTEYEAERAELHELLNEAEYAAARRTVINAHYTDPAIAAEVWGALQSLGFQGGRVLEPGSGAGTFIGLAPEGAQMTGVELDPVTAAISQAIYPDAMIRTESFADTRMPGGAFDAAVGNVPFSKNSLHDPRHNAAGHSMHNHFILKSLALTRPGGVVGVISSAFTLDAQNPAARREMAETADLLGAVRLPTGAHRRAAGTDALTDVLIFRRRLPGEEPLDQSWVETAPVELDGQQGRMNAYFLAHPARVLGEPVIGNGMYGSATLTVRSEDLAATGTRLHEQLSDITEQALAAGRGMAERTGEQEFEVAALVPAGEQEQIGHITDRGEAGFTQVTVDGVHAPLKVPRTQEGELRALLGLRDAARTVLTLEAANVEDTPELDAMRTQLAGSYEAYVDRYGPINRFTERRTGKYDEAGADILARVTPPAVRLLRGDPFGPLVLGLEHFDEGAGTAVAAGLLSERQVQPRRPVLGVDTPDEALAVTLDTLGTVDLPHIARLLGTDETGAREALGELVYEVPGENGIYETRAEYLSGDVREKLGTARAAAAADGRFQANVAALEAVLPAPLGADEIEARIGAVWVSPQIHEQFLRHIIRDSAARVDRISGASWDVKASRHVFAARNDWGTERMAAGDIFKKLLEQRRVQVTDPDPSDPEGNRRVVNATETTAAQEKASLMQERFGEWVWEDPERAAGLVDEYNRRFNSIVLRDYTVEGERLSFPGLVKNFTPRPHQRAAVARMLSEPSVGLFHEVGAGKTAEMVIGAMELRRLGMARKPVIVVPNHMLDQFSREWLQLYPQAQILAASSEDLAGDKRRVFVARAAASDWDGIIMTRTAFERIELSEESKAALDLRLVDPELGSVVAETKISAAADLMARVHEEHRNDVFTDPSTGEEHPTRGGLQIVFCDLGTPSESWNVYDELKLQLAERGVPAEKIRFMHEARNDAEKGRLFSAARTGEVAVLIGSTQKMGVGTNIQARAVHLVDLDAPWRPADVAQRHGRIIRQGNQNPEVAISQVVTKGSFDTFMWQTLERKSKFIDQIMRGRLDVREIEDVGDNTLSFAEVKAISSGNPLILEKSKADQELARLERLNRAWHRNQSSLVFRKDAAQARADALEREIPVLRAAAQRTTDELGGEKFRMTIDGRTYDKRADAAEAWQRWAGVHATSRPPRAGEIDLGVAGRIGGHDIRVVQRPGNLADLSASPVELRIDDAPGVAVEVTRATSLNPSVGMIQRLENQVRTLPEEVTKREARLASARQEVIDAREALDVPFKHQDALGAARWEVQRIGRAMRGEDEPQLSLDPELEALKKRMRLESPQSSNGRGGGAQRGGSPVGHSPEASRRHYGQRAQEDGLGL